MKKPTIPLWFFNLFWLMWFLGSLLAVVFNWSSLLLPLAFLFAAVETLGICFTVADAGTLTDTTAKYVPEDLTFIFMGLIFWRLTQWLSQIWIVWVLASWLLQHFIVHYQRSAAPNGWEAPKKLRRWANATLASNRQTTMDLDPR